ncbi:MAG: 30S ribosomal protein S12 methylthiotransferase RimO [Chloroflexi bacterium HGW-Chloroflexi-4]|jgi:ribosomal protein S12 methylthiotransferase|nr:MAG: 30S ribosomal protein S12 methylthiotransferase RimO [Chloroflexi bacterium HGW-Chloroflexi-4]
MKKNTFYLASLGCAKNTVDSDSMAVLLEEDGYHAVEKPNNAEVLIVNTCGFIQSARQESIDVLQELADKKKPGQILVAAGCLTERSRELMVTSVPGIDGFIGTRRWMDILDLVKQLKQATPGTPQYHIPESATVGRDEKGVVRASVQGASAYLKIADGCRRPCAFCSIPLIKGTTVSRPMEAIIEDAVILQDSGVKELILIAQDTTDYGVDLGMKDGLAELLETLLPRIPHIPWVRILYSYPGYVTDRLIDLMATSKQILPYFDIPLQHAHPDVLKRMKRPADMDWVRRTIEKLRKAIPDLAIRTTFIVGYPGETDAEFNALLDFMREVQFDHVGAFTFSFEPGTSSEPLGDTVSDEIKQTRLQELMTLQESISLMRNQAWIGKPLTVLIEGQGDGISVGRSFRDAPEIDGLVIVESEIEVGSLVPVLINGAMTHDLTGSLIS